MEECIIQFSEIASVGKDILLGLAAIVTSCVAIIGLNKWKQELQGKNEFEAARNLIRATYRLRDSIKSFRVPFVAAGEFPSDYSLVDNNTPEKTGEAYQYVYRNRWKPIESALQEFDASSMEAEALWGEEVLKKTEVLRKRLRELFAGIQAYISNKVARNGHFENDQKFKDKIESRIWDMSDDKNEFTHDISEAIEDIENLVKPYLRRS